MLDCYLICGFAELVCSLATGAVTEADIDLIECSVDVGVNVCGASVDVVVEY